MGGPAEGEAGLSGHFSGGKEQRGVDNHGTCKAGQRVDEIVGLDIHSGHAKEKIDRQEPPEHLSAARVPRQQHANGAHPHMAARESGRGSFAGSLGVFHKPVEQSVGIARTGQAVGVGVEVVVHGRKHTAGHAVESHSLVIERGAHHGQEDKHHVVDEKRAQQDEGHALELLVAEEEIPESHRPYHGIVEEIAHVHEFADHCRGEVACKDECRLETEKLLFPSGKHVVEVRKQAVDLVSVRIPPCQQRHLHSRAQHHRCPAGQQPVHTPHGRHDDSHAQTAHKHRLRVLEFGVGEKHHEQRQRHIGQHHPFKSHQSLRRFLLYLEYL